MNFVLVNGQYINLNHVRRIEPQGDSCLLHIVGDQPQCATGKDAAAVMAAITPPAKSSQANSAK